MRKNLTIGSVATVALATVVGSAVGNFTESRAS